jgi:dethiobiotin synthetase
MSRYFITGSGTGVGKTLLTCALVHQLRKEGRAARAIKPVISGFDADRSAESDTGMLLAAQGLALTQPSIEAVSPWRFAAPISPDMAAQDEGGAVEVDRLVSFCRAQEGAGLLLVEGVGGVMVPLNATHTVLDWMGALG